MPVSLPSFDLRTTVRDKLESSDIADPQGLADAIIDDGNIPKRLYADALRVTLPHYVREQIRIRRASNSTNGTALAATSSTTRQPRSGHDNHSTRWAKVEKLYRDRVAIGSGWVILGEATPTDIEAIVAEYDRRITGEMNARDKYAAVLALFEQHPKARVVRDLPQEDFTTIFA